LRCAWRGPRCSQQTTITPNYKEADIRQVIEAVGEVTGKNFVLDPRVRAQVTMLSAAPMSPDAFYEAFLSILAVYGFVAVPSGDVIKILPDANVRQVPGAELGDSAAWRPDDIVTQVIAVKRVAAAQLVPILRPLIPQYGHLAAHPPSNVLIISDRVANVERMSRIIRRIDQAGDEDVEVIRLEFATATDIVRVIQTLNQGAQQADGGGIPRATVVADERTNSLLVSGERSERLRARTLIAYLDTPLEEFGDTQVRYLRYTDATDLATKLQAQFAQPGTREPGAPPGAAVDVNIWADEATNSLVITAPPKTMRSLMAVVDKLDIRRLQVLVEAVIVEVSSDRAADLGVTWAVADGDLNNAVGATNFPGQTTGVVGLGSSLLGGTANPASLIGEGVTVGIGRISDSGTSFVALIEALEADTNTNIMGTPILVTMDNEEAEIRVGQQVPFVTGQFTNTGAAQGVVNPFQTIERKDVGLTLRVTPQINEGNAVVMTVSLETSNLSRSGTGGAVDLITNQRSITQRVLIEDGEILVLGGLVSDDLIQSESRVPLLGSIPGIGRLFRSESAITEKRTLMVFLRPVILRDSTQASMETNAKYRLMQNAQQDAAGRGSQFLNKNVPRPRIPEFEDLLPASAGYVPPAPKEGEEGEEEDLPPGAGYEPRND
jgi:general secretion pathway protein D